jgi:hypothetical protein
MVVWKVVIMGWQSRTSQRSRLAFRLLEGGRRMVEAYSGESLVEDVVVEIGTGSAGPEVPVGKQQAVATKEAAEKPNWKRSC